METEDNDIDAGFAGAADSLDYQTGPAVKCIVLRNRRQVLVRHNKSIVRAAVVCRTTPTNCGSSD